MRTANFTTETQRTRRLKGEVIIRRLRFPAGWTNDLKVSGVRALSASSLARPTTDRNLCNLRISPAFFLRFLCLPPSPSLRRDRFSRLFLALHLRLDSVLVSIRVDSRFLFVCIRGYFLRFLCLFAAINPPLRVLCVFMVKSNLSELCVSAVK